MINIRGNLKNAITNTRVEEGGLTAKKIVFNLNIYFLLNIAFFDCP